MGKCQALNDIYIVMGHLNIVVDNGALESNRLRTTELKLILFTITA